MIRIFGGLDCIDVSSVNKWHVHSRWPMHRALVPAKPRFKNQTCQFSHAYQIVIDCWVKVNFFQSGGCHRAINILYRKVYISLVRDIFDSCEPIHTCWNIHRPYLLEKISVSNNARVNEKYLLCHATVFQPAV